MKTRTIIILLFIVVLAIILIVGINSFKAKKIAEKEDELIELKLEQAAMEFDLDLDIDTDQRLSNVKDLNAFLEPTEQTESILKRWEAVHEIDPDYPYPEKEIKERDWVEMNHFMFGDADDEDGGAKTEMIYIEDKNIERDIYDYIMFGNTDTDDATVEEAEERLEE